MNSGNSINLKRNDKYTGLSNLSTYQTWKNIRRSYKNNRFKIAGSTTWNEGFELRDGSYSVSHIEDYFKYIFLKHKRATINP